MLLRTFMAAFASHARGGAGRMATETPDLFQFVDSPPQRKFQIELRRISMANREVQAIQCRIKAHLTLVPGAAILE